MLKRLSILSLFLLGTATMSTRADEIDPTAKERLGKNLAIFEKATKVEVFRIESKADKDAKESIAGYPIVSKGKEQGKEFVAKLKTVFTKKEVYTGSQARCFQPGIGFRLWNDKEYIDVAICFGCTNFVILGSDGTRSSGAFGGAGYAPVLEVVKAAFPDDKEIQAMKAPAVSKDDKK